MPRSTFISIPVTPPETNRETNPRANSMDVVKRIWPPHSVASQLKVLMADGSMTTREDATSARDIMLANGWQEAILVSHPLHLERARLLFEEQGITVYPSPTNTRLNTIPLRTRLWLTAREVVGIVWIGLEAFGVPYEWTAPLNRWFYGPLATMEGN